MKNLNFINHENGSEGLKNRGLTGLRVAVKSRIGTRSLRNTLLPVLIGTLLLTLGVGQMWADMGFENSNNGIKFWRVPLGGAGADYRVEHGRTNSTQEAGDVSSLYLKEWYAKLYQNEDNLWGDGHMYYRVYLQGSSAPNFTTSNKSYYNWNSWNSGWRYPTFGNNGLDVDILSGKASGKYVFEYYFDATATSTLYCSNNSSNFKVNFNIKPNALTSFSVSRSGYSAGSGTSADPYIIARGGSLTLTASGSGGTSDANSTIKYKYGSSDWQTTSYTISNITSTTNASIVVKGARRHNSQDYGGDEKSVTIYYKAETTYSVTVTNGTPASVYAGANYTKPTITASDKTGYHFDHWSTTGGASVASTTTSPTTVTATATGTVTANYEPNTYTITLDDNGSYQGNGSATATYDSGTLTDFSHASRTGWTPAGYYTGASTGSMVIDAAGNLVANVSTYTDASGNWIKAANTTLYARWKQTYSVTYYTNFPEGTTTSGAAPTDANEYNSGATVTVLGVNTMTATGYSFAGWNTNAEGTGTSRAAGSTFSISGNTPLYAQWTENMRNVTISAGTGGTVDKTSASVGVATTTTVTATAQPGYRFTGWTATNCSVASTSSASTTLSGNGTAGSGTLVANFERTYAYIEGRMTVYNAARSTETHVGSSKGSWDESSTRVAMDYDATNHRFYRHTYKTPTELSATQTDGTAQNQWFSIARSNASGSWSGKTTYHPSSNTDLTTTGIGQKKAAQTSTTSYNYKFNSSTTDGYAILYFDEAGVWYELEHTLNYNGNGSTSGSAPSQAYYNHGADATAAGAGSMSKSQYTFNGWNTEQYITGTSYAAGASVPMSTNTTLYAKWTRDITLNQNGATTNGSTSVTATYNCATLPTITAPSKTGYTFGGWNTANDGSGNIVINTSNEFLPITGWCDSGKRFTRTASDATLYAKWTQTVTLNANTANHGSGANKTATVILNATALSEITHCTPATGYHRVGYYTAATGGTKILNADGTYAGSSISSYITSSKWTKAGATTLYAHYEPNTYDVTLKANTGSGSDQVVEATYDAAMPTTLKGGGAITVHTKTGYNLLGYWDATSGGNQYYSYNVGTSTLSSYRTWNKTSATDLYAHWTPKTTAITLDQTGAATTGSVTTRTGTYGAAMPAITGSGSLPTAPQGYAFMGYFDDEDGEGTQYYNANGTSARTWNKEDAAVTLYAYFKKAEITALTLDATVVEIKGTVGVTPTISPTPTGDYKLCFYVFHGNDNPLDPQPEITWNGTKATFSAGATSGTFKIGVSLRTGSSCGGGTLLDSTTVSYQVAGVHTVTVRYKCGDDVIKASTSLEGIRPLDWSADITAPAITGYSFTEWEAGDGVTIKDAAGSDKTTSTYQTIKIKAVYDGYLTAKYSKKRVIYFNNTLNWANVYVYFYNSNGYWNDSKGVGSRTGGAYSGIHGQMQPIEEGSKIYYFDAEAAGVNSSWTHVAFTELEQNNYEFFAQTASKNNKVAYRGDYYATKLPMFVPLNVSESKNSGLADYYNKGYWMNYPENTGYTLKIYNQKATDGAVELKSIPFEFAENKAMPMELNVDLEAGQTYGFKIYRNDGLNTGAGSFYGNTGTMTANTEGWDMTTDASSNTGLQTTAAGTYKFLLNYYAVSSNYQYRVSVTYPVASGDYRLLYKDDVHTAWHPSAVVAKANAKDTVSFFVRTGKHAYLKLQKCTGLGAGTVTWKDTVTWWNNGSGIPAAVTQDSVYNICLKHNASNGKLEIEKVEAYTGNYYIRVDAANSKWDNYRTDPDHLMTYSEYSIKHGGYSHYYCHWIKTDDRKNIKFVIANDYSPCISDTLVRETASGEWENIGTFIESNGDIKCNANVRFMWYQHDNTIKRAYVDGAQEDGSEFLLMLNTDATAKIKWADGTALTDKKVTFSDNGNWIYEANVQAQPNAKIRLKSTWGEGTTIVQYFKGSSSTSEDLIGGSGTDWYPIRVLYDFKTNRIVASYVPATGTINSDVQINADVMFIREHQGDIAQLTFGVSGSISKIETAYGVLRFNKWTINNKDKSTHSPLASPKSRYERDLFYVSFPFRVSLEEVFGFGTYGKHWIVEYYDGAARAANGFWAETPTFWRFYTNRKGVFLEPDQGYILALDLDNLGESSDVWANTENVELYFPSYGSMPTITSSSVTHELPDHECTINRPTPDGNRTIKDSHWNIMSVPTYVNTNNVTFANDTWTASKPSFLYTWNMDDNSLTATSGKGYTYKAMHAYTVQYYGKVTWKTSVSPSSIVAHRTYAEAPSEVEFCLELQQNENMIDRTFVRMSNDADVDAEFVFGEDMSKDFNRNKANIYTKVTTLMDDEPTVTEVAGNCLPMSEQTTVVPMGIMTPKAGTYTIAIPSGTSGVGVTLIDNETGIRTNLALMDYTVDLDAGTYDDRFVLEISPMKHLTTDIEGVDDGQDEKIRKVLIDQQMYIIKDKTVFDARGARVK